MGVASALLTSIALPLGTRWNKRTGRPPHIQEPLVSGSQQVENSPRVCARSGRHPFPVRQDATFNPPWTHCCAAQPAA